MVSSNLNFWEIMEYNYVLSIWWTYDSLKKSLMLEYTILTLPCIVKTI